MDPEVIRCGAWFIWRNHEEFNKGKFNHSQESRR